MRLKISPQEKNTAPKSGLDRIIDFFNEDLEMNHPITIKEVVENTDLSYTFVKRTLERLKNEEYCGFHYEQSGATWIAWKDREHILPKMEDTCSRFLAPEDEESE